MRLTFGSLFSGIGGIDLGFERAGMECAWQVEKDEFCQNVLRKHWPGIPLFGEVREFNRRSARAVDVVCGGFPCQPHSLAGKRLKEKDDRDLWPETYRVIEEFQPPWFVGENVPGIRGVFLNGIYAQLEALGYEVTDLELPAASVNAPHRRSRVFILAHSRRFGLQRWPERRGIPGEETEGTGEGLQREWRRNTAGDGGEGVADSDVERLRLKRIKESGREQSPQGCLAERRSEVRQLDDTEARMVDTEGESQRTRLCSAEHEGNDARERRGRLGDSGGKDGFWDNAVWIECTDGSGKRILRRAKPKSSTIATLCGMVDGVPSGLVRLEDIEPLVIPHFKGRREQLRAIGNAVVPQLAERIGRYVIRATEMHYGQNTE